MKRIAEGEKPVLHEELITKKEKIEEEMFLGLRKSEGVSIQRFYDKYDLNIEDLYKYEVEMLKTKGWLEEVNGYLRMTKDGKLFGNDVFSSFLLEEGVKI